MVGKCVVRGDGRSTRDSVVVATALGAGWLYTDRTVELDLSDCEVLNASRAFLSRKFDMEVKLAQAARDIDQGHALQRHTHQGHTARGHTARGHTDRGERDGGHRGQECMEDVWAWLQSDPRFSHIQVPDEETLKSLTGAFIGCRCHVPFVPFLQPSLDPEVLYPDGGLFITDVVCKAPSSAVAPTPASSLVLDSCVPNRRVFEIEWLHNFRLLFAAHRILPGAWSTPVRALGIKFVCPYKGTSRATPWQCPPNLLRPKNF